MRRLRRARLAAAVGVVLLGWALAAIALGIGHGATDDQIEPLHLGQPGHEPLVVLRLAFRVDVEGDVHLWG